MHTPYSALTCSTSVLAIPLASRTQRKDMKRHRVTRLARERKHYQERTHHLVRAHHSQTRSQHSTTSSPQPKFRTQMEKRASWTFHADAHVWRLRGRWATIQRSHRRPNHARDLRGEMPRRVLTIPRRVMVVRERIRLHSYPSPWHGAFAVAARHEAKRALLVLRLNTVQQLIA